MAKKEKDTEKVKRKKKTREPEYCTSLLNTKVINYREYYMSYKEKLIYGIVIVVIAVVVAYLMYGGIGSDEAGNPRPVTHICNIGICSITALLALKFFMPIIAGKLKAKRRNTLRRQFMDLLDSLAASVSSGSNAVKAFEAAQNDLTMQYGDDAYIAEELAIILEGQKNFVDFADLLMDFGKRSGIKEIESFAQVFGLSYRKGGDFGRIIRDSYDILYNKIQIEMEIETKIAATKNELNIMLVMPVVLVGMMKMSGGDFAKNFSTPMGVLGTTIGLGIIIGSYFMGLKITDIEV